MSSLRATLRHWWPRAIQNAPILGIILVALFLRLFGINWDDGHLFHPDERFIFMTTAGINLSWPLPPLKVLLSPQSPLNPHAFAYGSLPFYLLRALTVALRALGKSSALLRGLDDFTLLRYTGRVLSALFDTGSVYLIYRLGRGIYGKRVGLFGAGALAVTVLNIQLAHFYAVDTLLNFFIVATLFGCWGILTRGDGRSALLTGVVFGLGLATKVSAAPLLLPIVVSYTLRCLTEDVDGQLRWGLSPVELRRSLGLLFLTLVATVIFFVLTSPYALIDFPHFVQDVSTQAGMARGTADFPYTRQFANRPNYLYFLQNLVLFDSGPFLGGAMLLGWLFVFGRTLTRPRRGEILLLAWTIPYFLIVGAFYAKFTRYILPLTPFLALFAADILDQSGRRLWAARRLWLRGLTALGGASVALGTLLFAVTFLHIYTQPHTAVRASNWIYAHVPTGSRIATEHWEEGVPVPLTNPQRDPGNYRYQIVQLPLYDDDNASKLQTMVTTLSSANYVIFFSNRLYGTIPRLPQRYPMSTRYYHELFSGELGFQLVAAFPSYPRLGPIAIVDDTFADPGLPTPELLRQPPAPITLNFGHADESYSVYDHPKVLVFKKVRTLSPAELTRLIGPAPTQPPTTTPHYRSLLLNPTQDAVVRAGGTFRDLFHPGDFANRFPVVTWVILLLLLGIIGVPISFTVLRALPDRGYLLSRSLAILLLGWIGWMGGSLGIWQATQPAARLILAGIFLAAVLIWFLQRRALLSFCAQKWRLLLAEEAVYWLAFFYFLGVRAFNPDLWHPARGGEKPMDLAYLIAVIRSPIYPPYDPWFSGGYINYYYYGQLLVGTLIKITGILPTTAYNLIIPTLFALSVAGAFTVAYALLERGGAQRARLGGLGAACFTCVCGNLGGALQLINQLASLGNVAIPTKAGQLAFFPRVLLGILLATNGVLPRINTDWYWASSRVIPGTINEFPYFTFLYADLHAHMLAFPFTLLTLAVALNLARGGQHPDASAPGRLRGSIGTAATLLAAALSVGALFPINSWDYPTYLGIVVLASVLPWYYNRPWTRRGLWTALGTAVAVGVLSQLLYLPFTDNFQSFYSSVHYNPDKSSILDYLTIHGLFFTIIVGFLIAEFLGSSRGKKSVRWFGILLTRWEFLPHIVDLGRALRQEAPDPRDEGMLYGTLISVGALALGYFVGMPLTGVLLAILIWVGFRALLAARSVDEGFLWLLIGTGLALGILTEQIALDGDVGRMNTVFKFYLQVWFLWGIASAVALVHFWDYLRCHVGPFLRRASLGGIGILFLATLVYPAIATPARVADRFDATIPPTLDGTAYMQRAVYADQGHSLPLRSDFAMLQWLQNNVEGTPTILEAVTPIYRWGSRVSIYTGLPTVLGWDWHQKQQRWGYQAEVDARARDVRQLYSADIRGPYLPTMQLLHHYQVRYIIVGGLERAYFPGAAEKFANMEAAGLIRTVYNSDGARIYEVTQ